MTFIEPLFMLVLMLILPPLFDGQIMIWWSTVFARILSAVLAIVLKQYVDKKEIQKGRPALRGLAFLHCIVEICQ